MLTVRSTINIASQTVPPIIPVVQGDTGRAILFTLADFTIPAGATATYYVQKPSGEAVYNNATIDGNNVLVELTAQSIIEKGDNYGQVRITVGEEVVTSFDFILLVKEFRGIDAVQSLTEMNIFDKAVEQASEAIDEVKTDALEAIDDAKDEAIEEVTSNFDLKLDASSTKGVQNQVITQAINTVNNAIGDLSGETVTPTATNNYGVGGNVGQVIETWATTEYWHGIYTVSAGNTYGITTVSDFPQQIVVWFTNSSNVILEIHKAFATDHVEMVCTAPTGATKLFVMSYGYDAYHGTVQKVEPLSETVSNLKDDFGALGDTVNDIRNTLIEYQFDLIWTNSKYINASNGSIGVASGYACTEEYYPVEANQQLMVNLYANGYNECTVAFYDESKSFLSYITGTGESIITVPSNGYARFTTKTSKITTDDAYVRNYIEDETPSDNFTYFGIDRSADACKETVNDVYCKTPVIRKTYKGNLNRQKRFLAIGFDDLRTSDINMIMPLFEKYRARATFNKVYNNSESSPTEKYRTERVFMGDHELGDHTLLHYSFPYFDPLWNGQNPSSLDGTQTPFPTNEDFRSDAGDGKNVFGKSLTGTVNVGGVSGVTWANLTDAQCQTIREHYSVLNNPTMSALLDDLSNRYLGTSGSSAGSYDSDTGKYTGGIFTGCSTSANHEVWERILDLISRYNKEALNINWDMYTWSRPGSEVSNLRVTYDGASYYDPDHLYLESPQTRFVSSLTGEDRSWTDALLNCGYKVSHDYPVTGNMNYYWVSRQMFFNAFLSKRDAIANMTNKTVNYNTLETAYPENFFSGSKSKAAQMYDVSNGEFRKFVEELRKNTANGLICGEMIDSTDNYSFRVFFENALHYCQSAGIELITKAEAYNIAFENVISDGNLIGNENLRNTVQEFIKDSENMPTNPDGYVGNCSVFFDSNGIPTLVTSGETYFIVFGAPYGKLKFTADVKGTGTIKFRGIRNNKEIAAGDYQHTLLSTITVNSDSDFTAQETVFTVPKADLTTYEPYYEGYGNRICAVKIIYSSGLEAKNIRMVVA